MKHCSIKNCMRPYYSKSYCQHHYDKVKRGVPLLRPSQKAHRPCVLKDEVAYLPLGVNAKKGFATVDRDNAHLDAYNWTLDGRGYPITCKDGKLVKLHHLVVGKPPEGLVVDHKNRNKLDARRSNLRVTSQFMNMHNMSMPSTNTSGVIGVTWDKNRSMWLAQIRIQGKHKMLGRYKTIEEATRARLDAEKQREQLYSENSN